MAAAARLPDERAAEQHDGADRHAHERQRERRTWSLTPLVTTKVLPQITIVTSSMTMEAGVRLHRVSGACSRKAAL